MDSIATLAVAQNMRELYRLVLIDTPLAPYFSECITSEVDSFVLMRRPLYACWNPPRQQMVRVDRPEAKERRFQRAQLVYGGVKRAQAD